MKYVLADWVLSDEGARPDLPEGCSFLWIAGESRHQGYGLFDISGSELSKSDHDRLESRKVPKSLGVLLDSCRVYPPALAATLREIKEWGGISQSHFLAEFGRLLRIRLEQQPTKPFFLARSRVTETGYREEGEFVWVVGYNPSRIGGEVNWVASDFQEYTNAIDTFDLDPGWMALRFDLEV